MTYEAAHINGPRTEPLEVHDRRMARNVPFFSLASSRHVPEAHDLALDERACGGGRHVLRRAARARQAGHPKPRKASCTTSRPASSNIAISQTPHSHPNRIQSNPIAPLQALPQVPSSIAIHTTTAIPRCRNAAGTCTRGRGLATLAQQPRLHSRCRRFRARTEKLVSTTRPSALHPRSPANNKPVAPPHRSERTPHHYQQQRLPHEQLLLGQR